MATWMPRTIEKRIFANNMRAKISQQLAHGPPSTPRNLPTASANSNSGGALFDRTKNGDILQRAFGGHTFKRLCHVGDRPALEMIALFRTVRPAGHRRLQECTVLAFDCTTAALPGRRLNWRETGPLIVFQKAKSIVIAHRGIGQAWRITSNSWEYTATGMVAYESSGRAHGPWNRPVFIHRNGLAARRPGHPGH